MKIKAQRCGNCYFKADLFGKTQGGMYDARIYCLCTHSDTVVAKTDSCGSGWRPKIKEVQ